jgi:hypothetical protein
VYAAAASIRRHHDAGSAANVWSAILPPRTTKVSVAKRTLRQALDESGEEASDGGLAMERTARGHDDR